MPNLLVNGVPSQTVRFKLRRKSTGQGFTGLAFNTSGLLISTIADNEAAPTAYAAAGTTIESITTLGTYAAPTATKCRFREVHAADHPGLCEFHFADARFAVPSAKKLVVSVSGVSDLDEADYEIEFVSAFAGFNGGLPVLDPNLTTRANVFLWNGIDMVSAGQALLRLIQCPSQAGVAANQVKLDVAASSANNAYRWLKFRLTNGTGAPQTRQCTAYDGASKVATVDRPWDIQPDATTVIALYHGSEPVLDATGAVNLATAYDLYHAEIALTVDEVNARDEYTVQWFKNGVQLAAADVNTPTIAVVNRSDGSDLIAAAALTPIGSTGYYKKDEATNRVTAGEAVVAIATATIGGSLRTFKRIVGRDSA